MSLKIWIALTILFLGLNGNAQDVSTDQKAKQYVSSGQGSFEGSEIKSNDLRISAQHVSSISGVLHIYLQEQHRGIDVLGSVGSVHLDQDREVAYSTNDFIYLPNRQVVSSRGISAEAAVRAAGHHFNLPQIAPTILTGTAAGSDEKQTFTNTDLSSRAINGRLVYLVEDGNLVLSWEVFLVKPDDGFMWLTYVNASSGAVNRTRSLTISCSHNVCSHDKHKKGRPVAKSNRPYTFESAFVPNSYNVFAIPLEAPNEGSRSVVVEPWNVALNASPFGWHDTDGVAGAEFTDTRGNNVFAEDDLDGNNGTPGNTADGGAMLMFDFPLDTSMQPFTYLDAAITNLFYMNNIMHDVTYQFGFDEAAGNFQVNNYGNGGLGSDEVFADAQDGSGLNNATFGTPPDGSSPSMTMFQWVEDNMEFTANAPGNVAGPYTAGGAAFNPINATVTGQCRSNGS